MFTLSEIEIIMRKRREEMISLLRDLGFSKAGQNWQEEIDSFITEKIRSLMKSASVFEGYSFLLRAAEIPQSYSETEKDKLAKIAANRAEIERRIIKRAGSVSPQYETRYTVRNTGVNPLASLFEKISRLEKTSAHLGRTERVKKNEKFIAEFADISAEIKRLQGLHIISASAPSESWTEEEFMSFIRSNGGNFLVSVSRERVPARPDPSEQYRKFTEEEARYMLDILERLNYIVNGI